MSVAPSPSTSRGDLILQPSFFTSSLFVTPFRADLQRLTHLYVSQYAQSSQPFALFKQIWAEQGWTWIHLKVFDDRTREAFLRVACRLFVERLVETEAALHRVVALFALYTFYATQPRDSFPPLYVLHQVAIPIDTYASLLSLPTSLGPLLSSLAPYTVHILQKLLTTRAFHILPSSTLQPNNPRTLPREIFVPDDTPLPSASIPSTSTVTQPKKKGRPSKSDRLKKTRDAVTGLDRWLERTEHTYRIPTTTTDTDTVPADTTTTDSHKLASTHILLSNAPTTSRTTYQSHKSRLLDALLPLPTAPLTRANTAVLARLKHIDAVAAERGMEVGGEGGESTGLTRVERAVGELALPGRRGGILGLLEGGGLEVPFDDQRQQQQGGPETEGGDGDGTEVPMQVDQQGRS
ncbi:hypothetical protein EW146_g6837 [Bondarzewia mesenterica]|uniref:Uncharacterized protein n=1 Tax=Bondarzewia mesenterica TaxID=1095465 RepID=A0A4S4LMD3_9AGAM|nr:hypothetical protein EW146_g6837 [Bondarzewia mesenterica]